MSLTRDQLGYHEQKLVFRLKPHLVANLLHFHWRYGFWPVESGVNPDAGHITYLLGGDDTVALCGSLVLAIDDHQVVGPAPGCLFKSEKQGVL